MFPWLVDLYHFLTSAPRLYFGAVWSSALIHPKRAPKSFIAGNPLQFASKAKEWKYWVADISDAAQPGQPAPNVEPIRGTIQRIDRAYKSAIVHIFIDSAYSDVLLGLSRYVISVLENGFNRGFSEGVIFRGILLMKSLEQ